MGTGSAAELLEAAREELEFEDEENELVPLIAAGRAHLAVLATLAGEQYHVITSDWRSFLTLAARADALPVREVFTVLAHTESLALPKLVRFAAGCGLDSASLTAHEPQAGCQAYPAYLAWLALNADPADALLALAVNFAAWGGYCATVARALRQQYHFDEEACGFFDLFATPSPELDHQIDQALQVELDAGWRPDRAMRHARLVQSYELMFWNTLAN